MPAVSKVRVFAEAGVVFLWVEFGFANLQNLVAVFLLEDTQKWQATTLVFNRKKAHNKPFRRTPTWWYCKVIMRGSALIYSSHNRGEYLHNKFIVERALQGNGNILFLPMSETVQNGSEMERQDYSWGTFRWYFDRFKHMGLNAWPFFWSSRLSRADVNELWRQIWSADVVILGGGHSLTGMRRYKELGHRFDNEWGKFGRLLHERKNRGLFTVGFSAGADQLCESLYRRTYGDEVDGKGFGLIRKTMVTLHHERSRNGDLESAARQFGDHFVFGLPNDAGINHDWGQLRSGNFWQVYEFVIDNSWDLPNDAFHIKTRFGEKVEHVYNDGRSWSFNGGDLLVRVESPDGRWGNAWIRSNGNWLHYASQQRSSFGSVEQILAHHLERLANECQTAFVLVSLPAMYNLFFRPFARLRSLCGLFLFPPIRSSSLALWARTPQSLAPGALVCHPSASRSRVAVHGISRRVCVANDLVDRKAKQSSHDFSP